MKQNVMNANFSKISPGMFVTDFDGTLFHRDLGIHEKDLEALSCLRAAGVITALATGRSFGSFERLSKRHDIRLPVDYLILSSGALILENLESGPLLAVHLEATMVQAAIHLLNTMNLDFMVHAPYPESNRFYYRRNRKKNTDFDQRLGLNVGDGFPLSKTFTGEATEIVSIVPADEAMPFLALLREKLPDCNIIRASSPFGTNFTWIEIFPAHVSKSRGAAWLANHLGIPAQEVVAMGNDYNDEDLLTWAARAFVTRDTPLSLKKRFFAVPGPSHGSVSGAIRQEWKNLFPEGN